MTPRRFVTLAAVFVAMLVANHLLDPPAAVGDDARNATTTAAPDNPSSTQTAAVVAGPDRTDPVAVALWVHDRFGDPAVSLDATAGDAVLATVATGAALEHMQMVNRAGVQALVGGLPAGVQVHGDAIEFHTIDVGSAATVRVWGSWTLTQRRTELRRIHLTHRYELTRNDDGWALSAYSTSSGPDPVADAAVIDAMLLGFDPVPEP